MKYYLIYDKVLMRGKDDDVTTFEVFNFDNGNWEEDFELAWFFLYDGGISDYKIISEQQAQNFINAYHHSPANYDKNLINTTSKLAIIIR